MSKYIDERPFEEIIHSIYLDGKHQDYIEDIVNIVTNDESTCWRTNTFRGDSTMYEQEVFHLQTKRKGLQSEFDQIEKHYQSTLGKLAELEKLLGPIQKNEDENEEEDDYDDEYYQETKAKGKGKGKGVIIGAKRRQNEVAYQNFKSTLATLQEELRSLLAQIKEIDVEIKRNEYYHDIGVKSLRTLRRIVNHYKENKDSEYLKKGIYFTKNYSDMLLNRYRDD
jgi:chromosome segregation ATPase